MVKNSDKIADMLKNTSKHSDEAAQIVQDLVKNSDNIADLAKSASKYSDELVQTSKDLSKKADQISEALQNISKKTGGSSHGGGAGRNHISNGINEGSKAINGSKRIINGFDTTVNAGKQGKHIVGNNNFIEGRSIFNGTVDNAQRLVDNFAGTGEWIGTNKERINFGEVIGQYVNPTTKEAVDTTVGVIHYSKTGTHIVPAQPIQ